MHGIEIASSAPHDVVYLDGSLTTSLIAIDQGLNKIGDMDKNLENLLLSRISTAMESYSKIVTCERTDKIFAGIPKYTTRTEISKDILNLDTYEDRGLLTFVLEAGEFVGPVPIQKIRRGWHINQTPIQSMNLQEIINQIFTGLNELQIVYYRPCSYFPVLRIEIAKAIS